MKGSLVEALAVTMTAVMCAGLVSGCGAGSDSKKTDIQAQASGAGDDRTTDKSYELTVSDIGGNLNYLPIYIAEQERWFKEKGPDIEEMLSANGPVQTESLSSDGWDIGCTGVGDAFAGVLGYDALILDSDNTDDGTQYVFARNDSGIVKAGKGHNNLSDEIYGDTDSQKGKSILCNTGSITQYVLIRTLEGLGLTVNDVNFITMDPATAYSIFLAGEGDVCILTGSGGTFKALAESDRYTPVASGPMIDSGLICSFMANKNSYVDPDKCETIEIFMKVYFKTINWIKKNKEKTIDYCVDMNDENGSSMDREATAEYLEVDTCYTLYEACGMLDDKEEGSDNTALDQKLLGVLDFFISVGNYRENDQERFVGHTDGKLLNKVLTGTANQKELRYRYGNWK